MQPIYDALLTLEAQLWEVSDACKKASARTASRKVKKAQALLDEVTEQLYEWKHEWKRRIPKNPADYDLSIPADREHAIRATFDVLNSMPWDVVYEAFRCRLGLHTESEEVQEEIRELLRRNIGVETVNAFIYLRSKGHVALDKRSKEAA